MTSINRQLKAIFNKYSKLPSLRYAALVLLPLITIVSYIGWQALSSAKTNRANFYTVRLKVVQSNINAIANGISHPMVRDTKALPAYYRQLDGVTDNCDAMIKRADSPAEPSTQKPAKQAAAKFKDQTTKTSQLCSDLIPVVSYQKSLYGQLEVVIYTQTQSLPPPESPEAPATVRQIAANLAQAQANIKRIKNDRFTDPARDEINIVLQRLTDQTAGLLAKPTLDPAGYNLLLQNLNLSRDDLLVRRAYYWLNTVQIDSLQLAIKQQIEAYSTN